MPRGVPKNGARKPRVKVGDNGQPVPVAEEKPKPTQPAAAVGDNVSDAIFLKHLRVCTDAKTEAEEAKAVYQTVNGLYRTKLKEAKADGIDTAELAAVMAAKKKEPADVIASTIKRLRYLQLAGIPIGTQLGIFSKPNLTDGESEEQAEWDADTAGYEAGRTGGAQDDNPHTAGSGVFAAWVRGFKRGMASIAKQMGKNARVASTRRSRKKQEQPELAAVQ